MSRDRTAASRRTPAVLGLGAARPVARFARRAPRSRPQAAASSCKPSRSAILPLEPTAQVMYAKHRGFFKKQGLDVRIEVLADPTQTPAALISGNVQFAALNLGGLAFLKTARAPIKAVAAGALYDHNSKTKTSALVAMPSKSISECARSRRQAHRRRPAEHDRPPGHAQVAQAEGRPGQPGQLHDACVPEDARAPREGRVRRSLPPRAVPHACQGSGRERRRLPVRRRLLEDSAS